MECDTADSTNSFYYKKRVQHLIDKDDKSIEHFKFITADNKKLNSLIFSNIIDMDSPHTRLPIEHILSKQIAEFFRGLFSWNGCEREKRLKN